MYLLGRQPIGYNYNIGLGYPVYSRNKWKIFFYHKDGGLKKYYTYDMASYLKAFEFEENDKLCGAASLTLSFLDFPIYAGDYIDIYYDNTAYYSGYVNSVPDKKGGKIKIEPFHKRLENTLYSGTFTNKTIKEIIQTILTAKSSETMVTYNSAYMTAITETTTYTFTYNYEKIKKIIDELIEKVTNVKWGVNAYRILECYTLDSTVTENIGEKKRLEVTTEADYADIEATRYQVYKKDSNDDDVRVGQVGYGSGYNPIDLEDELYIKESKYNVTQSGVSDTEAKDMAYGKLLNIVSPFSVKIKGYNLDYGKLSIGQKISCADNTELILKRIIECNALTDDTKLKFCDIGNSLWNSINCTLSVDTVNYIHNKKSIKAVYLANNDSSFYYDFINEAYFLSNSKISFMMRSDKRCIIDLKLFSSSIELTDDQDELLLDDQNEQLTAQYYTSYSINIETPNKWTLFEFPATNSFYRIQFNVNQNKNLNIWVGEVNIFGYFREQYEGNIKKMSYKIDYKNNKLIDIDVGAYSKELNTKEIIAQYKIEELENLIQRV